MMTDSFELDDLVIDSSGTVNNGPNTLVHSLKSIWLPSYDGGIIDSSKFDTDESLRGMGSDYVANYRRFLVKRRIHLGSLVASGFINPKYDLSFVFDKDVILSRPCFVCDHDFLSALLLYGGNMSPAEARSMFREAEEYKPGDEVLVHRLDLSGANKILMYSPVARERVSSVPALSNVPVFDLSEVRSKFLAEYEG